MKRTVAIIALFLSSVLVFSDQTVTKRIILRGENRDFVYNTETASVWSADGGISVKKWGPHDSGYYFAGEHGIFRLQNGKITSADSDTCICVKDILLPFPSEAESIQEMLYSGCLFLPVQSGFLLFDLEKQSVRSLPYVWKLHSAAGSRLDLTIPKFSVASHSLWALDSGNLRRFSGDRWVEVMQVPEKDLIETRLLAGKKFVNLLLFKVTQGDLGSFRTRIFSFSTVDGHLLMDQEFDGVLKNTAVDRLGRVVYEYVEASLLSALWGRKKVKLRMIDPGKKKVFTDAYSVGDKRRHLFYLFGRRGALLLVVQCKNGDVFVIRPFQGRMRKLRKVKFGYDYTLIRGVGNGVFYNEKTGNRVAVSFESVSGGS